MTELKQAVEAQPEESTDSATKQQGTAARNRKPAVPRSQTKSPAKSPARKPAFPSRTGASVSKMKANATKAEALEHENVAVQNKRTSHSPTDATDVSGVIVPSENEEMNILEQEPPFIHDEEKHGHKKADHKHHSKDKNEHSTRSQVELVQESATVTVDQPKHLDILKKKALKSEKKVKKLKKKVHKAEKKQVKTSKIRALKEKLTKAFAKWQRRKKRVEETDK
jgi:hypothetical protein